LADTIHEAVSEPLPDDDDAFGRLLLDHLSGGETDQLMLELDDGRAGPALPADVFFAEHAAWHAAEQRVFEAVRGRVLDVGCGAGRHSLEAERRGLDVVAIDVSPGAVEVCRRRGVRDARLLPLHAVDASLGVFDTVLMLCGNFGLVGTADDAVPILRMLHELTAPGGRIVLDSVDPYEDADAGDLAYQERNRERGRAPGQVTIRLRYAERATPWYELLNVSACELEKLAGEGGWQVAELVDGDPGEYYAVLEKRRRGKADGTRSTR
jgi:SAM-dependent methyltransferase